jgi:hypothetical protein
MTKKEKQAIESLETAILKAIHHVNIANYKHREDHAMREVYRNFTAFQLGKFNDIEFREN